MTTKAAPKANPHVPVFVELTDMDGNPVFISTNQIDRIHHPKQFASEDSGVGATLMIRGNMLNVKEPMEVVKSTIIGATD